MTTKTDQANAEKEALLEELGDRVESIKTSEGWLAWLDFASHLHTYSFRNTMLISMQCEDATVIMPYGAKDGSTGWLSVGRQVRKGERGIRIFAPVLTNMTQDEADARATERTDSHGKPKKVLRTFKLVSVFDVSQTDGDPLPESPAAMYATARREELNGNADFDLARTAVEALGFTVEVADAPRDGAYGWHVVGSKHVTVVRDEPTAMAKTLLHETAHASDAKLQDGTRKSYAQAELVAESVAWFVGRRLGIAMSDTTSAVYLAAYKADPDKLEEIANDVLAIAKKIETAFESVAKKELAK